VKGIFMGGRGVKGGTGDGIPAGGGIGPVAAYVAK